MNYVSAVRIWIGLALVVLALGLILSGCAVDTTSSATDLSQPIAPVTCAKPDILTSHVKAYVSEGFNTISPLDVVNILQCERGHYNHVYVTRGNVGYNLFFTY